MARRRKGPHKPPNPRTIRETYTYLYDEHGNHVGFWDEKTNNLYTPNHQLSDPHRRPTEFIPWGPINKQTHHNREHMERFAAVKRILDERDPERKDRVAVDKLVEELRGELDDPN